MTNISIWPVDRTLSGATTPGHSRPGSEGNDGILRIPQRSSITGARSSDCLVLNPGHSLARCLLLCRNAIGVFYSPRWRVINDSDSDKENEQGSIPTRRVIGIYIYIYIYVLPSSGRVDTAIWMHHMDAN